MFVADIYSIPLLSVGDRETKVVKRKIPQVILYMPEVDRLHPDDPKLELTKDEESQMLTISFQEILGSFLFLSTRTRPDLSVSVSILGKFASAPSTWQWKAMKHVYNTSVALKRSDYIFRNRLKDGFRLGPMATGYVPK